MSEVEIQKNVSLINDKCRKSIKKAYERSKKIRLAIQKHKKKIIEDAEKITEKLKYPVIIRPAYTLGGTGGGIAYNVEELRTITRLKSINKLRNLGKLYRR